MEMKEEWWICINRGITGHQSRGDNFSKYYEFKLKIARTMAFITNVMYSLNWFLSFCALTWASAVVLGGLVAQLTKHDYFSTLALLLLEAVRLAVTTFFGKFVTWKLVHGSVDPHRLVYNDALRQKIQGIARILEQAFQLTVFAISILVSVRRLMDLKTLNAPLPSSNQMAPAPSSQGSTFDGSLNTSLRIFYVLVLLNGAIAGIGVIFSKNVVPFFVNTPSLRKYYEKIVWKGMDEGLLHATEFELLSWAFEMQADEYRRNTRAPVMKELYGDMMKYLYFHPRSKGFEAAKVALESDDTYEREAAANIVGLWTELAVEVETPKSTACTRDGDPAVVEMAETPNGHNTNVQIVPNAPNALVRLVMQKKLLAKLAEALDNDETGRAASVSFQKLAEKDPEGILGVISEGSNEKLADILMDRIHEAVKSRRPQKVIIDIKVMIALLSKVMKNPATYCNPDKLRTMEEDMRMIVTEYKTDLKRMQAVAAKAYDLLCGTTDQRERLTKDNLRALLLQKPEFKQHILEDEAKYLYEMPGLGPAPALPAEWDGAVKLRDIKKETPPLPWLARRSTALLASVLEILILVVASVLIMRYAHF